MIGLALRAVPLQAQDLPNIVIIFADDLGYGDVGVYNPESKIPTPRLDQLAREGIRFTDAHAPATICSPSRFGLLSGALVHRTGRGPTAFEGASGPSYLAENRLSLGGMLQAKGYTTAVFGKWHVGLTWRNSANEVIRNGTIDGVRAIDYARSVPLPDGPLKRGFHRAFVTPNCPTTDPLYLYLEDDRVVAPATSLLNKDTLPRNAYTWDNDVGMVAPGYLFQEADLLFLDKGLKFMREHRAASPGKPFFLMLATQIAHAPAYVAPAYKGKTAAGPQGDFIHELDAIAGKVLDALDSLGLARNTLVLFSSDNGPETVQTRLMREEYRHDSSRPWRGMKRDGWEGGHRVPFLARWMGTIPAGQVTAQPLNLTDVLATVASLVGYPLPDAAGEDSYDLLPVLLGRQEEAKPIRPYNLTQSFRGEFQIRKGQWKLLDHKGSGGNNYASGDLARYALPELDPAAAGQLYDMGTDPGETTNLWSKRPEVVKELKDLLEKAKAEGRSAPRNRKPLGVGAWGRKGELARLVGREPSRSGAEWFDFQGRRIPEGSIRSGLVFDAQGHRDLILSP